MGNQTKLLAVCIGILILGLLAAPVLADRPASTASSISLAYPIITPPPYPPPDPDSLIYLPVVMR